MAKIQAFAAYVLEVGDSPIRLETKPDDAFYGDLWNGPEGIWVFGMEGPGWVLVIPREKRPLEKI